ncbi:MAG: transporter substrate-binding domain-containing protein, partial [Pseudomonadota bacterium]|nr:transporter substrate-binding domain-containing protein [Pseudomonadota bacterium]
MQEKSVIPNQLNLFRKILIVLSYIAIVAVGINGYFCDIVAREALAAKPGIVLTAEERAWLDSHPFVRVHNEKDWTPFNFHKNGIPQGFSIDFMNLIAQKMGFRVEYVTGPAWNEFLEMTKRKELDVMLNIAQSAGRENFLSFTDPY